MPLYEAQTWANGPGGGTPVSASRFTHMETGILDSSTRLGVLEPKVDARAPILVQTGIKTGTYAAVSGDLVRVDATAGPISITLPTAAAGLMIAVKKIDSSANAVTITPAGADTIDTLSSITLTLSRESRVLLGMANGWVVQTGLTTVSSLDTRYDARYGTLANTTTLQTDTALLKGPGMATSGAYYYTSSPNGVVPSNTLGVGTLRVVPWVVPKPLSISRIGAEIATVGEAGSKLRLGVYNDNGSGLPGTLLFDSGQINGDSATVQEITATRVIPAGLYWVGGVVQSVTTTQPTVRIASVVSWTPPVPIWLGPTIPTSNSVVLGVSMTGVTAALPTPFVASASTAFAPRVFVKIT